MSRAETLDVLENLFAGQKLAVLATHGAGQPYGSLVAFAAGPDLRTLLFATARATRKYANLTADPRVALLIDNRSNDDADFHEAVAATVIGSVTELAGDERARELDAFLARHPHLREFAGTPTCALLRVQVETYIVVSRFQQVVELRM